MESLQRFKIKLLATRYGHPEKALKLIVVAGSPSKAGAANSISTIARLIQEVLAAAGLKSAVLATEENLPAGTLYQFMSEAVKEGNNYAVITAPLEAIVSQTFTGLPIEVAALVKTDEPENLSDAEAEDFGAIFANNPENVVLNHDDYHFANYEKAKGAVSTLTYGATSGAEVRIESSTLYKKGTEVILSHGPKNFTVASFLTGEEAVQAMAATAAIASALHITPAAIAEGLGNFAVDK